MSRRSRAAAPRRLVRADEPQLQRAEPPAQRDAPVAQVLHLPIRRALQVGRGWSTSPAPGAAGPARKSSRASNGTPSHLCGFRTRLSARLDASPQAAGIGRIIALPAMAASTCSHIPCSRRDLGQGADRVDGGDRGGTGGGDHGAGAAAGGEVGFDQAAKASGRMAEVRRRAPAGGFAAEAGQQRRLLDRAVACAEA